MNENNLFLKWNTDDNSLKKRSIREKIKTPNINKNSYINPNAHICTNTNIGKNSYINPNAHICANTNIGKNSYINPNAHISSNTNIYKNPYININDDIYISDNINKNTYVNPENYLIYNTCIYSKIIKKTKYYTSFNKISSISVYLISSL
ncbi:hypothetical protein YYE_04990 [Plasmodium vinckei vinckei]|uniref:Uncharacterized protein n=1 Tax=Plasmodium vinckei vinckei TaxID=54757 RepID=A0A081I904_PLAVN|nr:hypothetical protein YYE_04990 [Plasmodium vinckei vinckei]